MEPEFASEDFLSCSLGGGGRYFSVPSHLLYSVVVPESLTDSFCGGAEIITFY